MPTLNINGKDTAVNADGSTPILWALRDTLGMTRRATPPKMRPWPGSAPWPYAMHSRPRVFPSGRSS